MTKRSRISQGMDGWDSRAGNLRRLWPRLVDIWLALVLLLFFLIRVLGSHTAKHILNLLGIGRTG